MSLITITSDGMSKQINSFQVESTTFFYNGEEEDSYIVQLGNGEQYSIAKTKYNEIKAAISGTNLITVTSDGETTVLNPASIASFSGNTAILNSGRTIELSDSELALAKSEVQAYSTGGGGGGASIASAVSLEPISGLEATNVQDGIEELVSSKANSDSLSVVATSGSYNDLINKPSEGISGELYSVDFSKATELPDWFAANADWEVSGGKLTNLSSRALWTNKKISIAERETIVEFSLNKSTAILYFRWYSDGGLGNCGSVFVLTNSKLTIYDAKDDATTTTVRASKSIAITTGRRYIASIEKDLTANKITIYDGVTGVFVGSVGCDQTGISGLNEFAGGRQLDTFGLTVPSESVNIYNITIKNKISNPLMVVYGDSITEGASVYSYETYGYLLKRYFGANKIAISGYSGSKIDSVINRINAEIPKMKKKPEFVMVTVGTNGGNSLEKFNTLTSTINGHGCTPIINVPPMMSSGTTISTITPMILAQDCMHTRFDIATAIDNDTTKGINTSLYADSLHPNAAGHLAMFNRMRVDLKELFNYR